MLPEPEKSNSSEEPYIEIIEQPKPRGFRFRYSCEGPSHGGIPGASSDRNRKNYPGVQIKNYTGYARIVVQLVTNEENPRLHPHSLVGKQCQNGICTVQCGPKDMTATFPNLGIEHVTKKNVAKILEQRYLAAELQLSTVNEGYSPDIQNAIKGKMVAEEDRTRIQAKAQAEAKSIDLSVVRLMFIAYLPDSDGAFTIMLKPVISDAIFDSKAPNAATLKICRMDRTDGYAKGNDEIYLLCDKVQKDDIQVRFFEDDPNGSGTCYWEAYGNFSPSDVHRQFAIVFATPPYHDVNIKHKVNVQVQLRRKSDGETSEPRKFTYIPVIEDAEGIDMKRRKVNLHFPDAAGDRVGGRAGGYKFSQNNLTSDSFNFQTNGTSSPSNGNQAATQHQTGPAMFPIDPTRILPKKAVKKEPPKQEYLPGTQIPLPRPFATTQMSSSPQTSPFSPQADDYQVLASPATAYDTPPSSSEVQWSPESTDTTTTVHEEFPTELYEEIFGQEDYTQHYFTNLSYTSTCLNPDIVTDAVRASPSDGESSDDDDTTPTITKSQFDTIKKTIDTTPTSPKAVKPKDETSIDKLTENISKVKIEVEEAEKTESPVAKPESSTPTPVKTEQNKMNEDMLYLSSMDKTYLAELILTMTENTSLALQDYALTGDIGKLLTVMRFLATSQNEEGDTLLHTSLYNEQTHVFDSLMRVITTIPDDVETINLANNKQQTALHIAVICRNAHAVKKLLKSGANPLLGDENGDTSMHIACENGFSQILEILLQYVDADEILQFNLNGFSPLHMACKPVIGARQCISLLLEKGMDVNVEDIKAGRTPLHLAVEIKNLSIVGYLITKCLADIEARTFNGYTALHLASANDSIDAARLLLACGANIAAESMEPFDPEEELQVDDDDFGCLPVHLAASDKMYKLLINGSESDDESTEICDDIEDLDPVQRHKLCCLLDKPKTGNGWVELASALNLSPIVTSIKNQEKSPTDCLLDNYSCVRGKIGGLCMALEKIGRNDALEIINAEDEKDEIKAVTTEVKVNSEKNKDDYVADEDRVESGIESMPLSIATS